MFHDEFNDTRLFGLVFDVLFLKVERRIDLVYGGSSMGLMGLVSQAVHDGGRHVIGFVPSLSLSLFPKMFITHIHIIIFPELSMFFYELGL